MSVFDDSENLKFSDLFRLEIYKINYNVLYDRVPLYPNSEYDSRILKAVYESMDEVSDTFLLRLVNGDINKISTSIFTRVTQEIEILRHNIVNRTIPATLYGTPITLDIDWQTRTIELRAINRLKRMYTIIFSLKYHKI